MFAKELTIVKTFGEVMLHDNRFGWTIGRAGMSFPAGTQVAVKTGSGGGAEIINSSGERISVPANSMIVISEQFCEDDVDTLREFKLTGRDMLAARRVHKRLIPAF
ncbi:MAG TPA: hypothetical protein VJL58_05660 [Pyrinomonadaceae bacterium]|nr:hypothetical protein [Pyrinomonadaceae bacterium]